MDGGDRKIADLVHKFFMFTAKVGSEKIQRDLMRLCNRRPTRSPRMDPKPLVNLVGYGVHEYVKATVAILSVAHGHREHCVVRERSGSAVYIAANVCIFHQ